MQWPRFAHLLLIDNFLCIGENINEADRCKRCLGRKTTQEQKIIEVKITPGMRENQKIVFYGEGDQEPGNENLLTFIGNFSSRD